MNENIILRSTNHTYFYQNKFLFSPDLLNTRQIRAKVPPSDKIIGSYFRIHENTVLL